MKIATHNSEKLLLADLREARIGNPSHRCLFLRLSQAKEPIQQCLSTMERAVRYALTDSVDQIYLTHDNDVFITGWGLTNKSVKELLTMMADALDKETMTNMATLFEIGVHWDRLESLCTEKIRLLAELQEKEKAKQKQEKEAAVNALTEIEFEDLDYPLAKSTHDRRLKRKEYQILVVEDDLFSQTLIKKALGTNKYNIAMASDGKSAIHQYIHRAPDIMFLDIELPDINGHRILEKVKEFDDNAYIIMFSGNGDRENVIKAIDLGASGFVGKPFQKEKLIQYIEKAPTYKLKMSKSSNSTNSPLGVF